MGWWNRKRRATKVALGAWGVTALVLGVWALAVHTVHGSITSGAVYSSLERTVKIADSREGFRCNSLEAGRWNCEVLIGSGSDVSSTSYLVQTNGDSSCWAAVGYPDIGGLADMGPDLADDLGLLGPNFGSDPPSATGCVTLRDSLGTLGPVWRILAALVLFLGLPLLLFGTAGWALMDRRHVKAANRRRVSQTPERPGT